MKRYLKNMLLVMGLVVLVFSFSACGSNEVDKSEGSEVNNEATAQNDAAGDAVAEKTVRIGFSQCQSSDPWRVAQINSIMNEAEARGYELVYTDAGGDTAKQISDVEDIVAQKVDYLILDPLELEGSVPALEAAKRAGVPTIIIDRMVNGTVGEDFITYIGTDFVWEGKAAGEWLVEKTGGNAKIVEITGTAGSAAAIDRQNGFMEAIAGSPDMEVIVSQTANFSRSEAVKVMENIIQAKAGEFNVVFAHNDQEALGVIQALKSAGLVPGEDVIVVGIDGEKDAVKSIIAGELSATVTCNPLYGPIVFDTLEQIMTGNTVPENIILADYIIDGSNAEEKLADAF